MDRDCLFPIACPATRLRNRLTNPYCTLRRFEDMTHMSTRQLLIADDDPVFLRSLQRAMERRTFDVTTASTLDDARGLVESQPFDFGIFEVRLGRQSGLDLLEHSARTHPDMRCIILTGYGDVATAVSATKLGALDYLAKPSDAETISSALLGTVKPLRNGQTFPRPEVQEFRYILAMYEKHGRNMSETARAAGMHRRTLQRILRRHGVGPSEHIPPEDRTTRPHLLRLYRLWSQLLDSPSNAPIGSVADETGAG